MIRSKFVFLKRSRWRLSRQLVYQSSPDIEAYVVNDLSNAIGVAVDLAAINGTGISGHPIQACARVLRIVGFRRAISSTVVTPIPLTFSFADARSKKK